VIVRLAHEQGIIHQPDLNHFQHFALLYWIYLDKRGKNQAMRDALEIQCFNLFFERWEALYQGQPGSVLTAAEGPEEEIVDDIDVLEQFYSSRGATRVMSGADAFDVNPYNFETDGLPSADAEWGDWR
jgi:hypothetical protein